jgi:hypothetical protein
MFLRNVSRGVSLQENATLCAQKLKTRCAHKSDAAVVCAKLKAMFKFVGIFRALIVLMMEAVRTSETSVSFYQKTVIFVSHISFNNAEYRRY